jgi:hypothetical protein
MKVQWVWNVARMGQVRNAHKFLTEKEFEGEYYLGS